MLNDEVKINDNIAIQTVRNQQLLIAIYWVSINSKLNMEYQFGDVLT